MKFVRFFLFSFLVLFSKNVFPTYYVQCVFGANEDIKGLTEEQKNFFKLLKKLKSKNIKISFFHPSQYIRYDLVVSAEELVNETIELYYSSKKRRKTILLGFDNGSEIIKVSKIIKKALSILKKKLNKDLVLDDIIVSWTKFAGGTLLEVLGTNSKKKPELVLIENASIYSKYYIYINYEDIKEDLKNVVKGLKKLFSKIKSLCSCGSCKK